MNKPELSKIQRASSKLSQEWKKQSRELLLTAENSQDFKEAVIWCGKGGNVVRSLSKCCVSEFADHLWEKRGDILAGEYNLSNLPAFGGKRPISWASKIIHIMKPQKYPIIYDSQIRGILKIGNIDDYMEEVKTRRKRAENKKTETLFADDSDQWASSM